jgi:hypothetical protein
MLGIALSSFFFHKIDFRSQFIPPHKNNKYGNIIKTYWLSSSLPRTEYGFATASAYNLSNTEWGMGERGKGKGERGKGKGERGKGKGERGKGKGERGKGKGERGKGKGERGKGKGERGKGKGERGKGKGAGKTAHTFSTSCLEGPFFCSGAL